MKYGRDNPPPVFVQIGDLSSLTGLSIAYLKRLRKLGLLPFLPDGTGDRFNYEECRSRLAAMSRDFPSAEINQKA